MEPIYLFLNIGLTYKPIIQNRHRMYKNYNSRTYLGLCYFHTYYDNVYNSKFLYLYTFYYRTYLKIVFACEICTIVLYILTSFIIEKAENIASILNKLEKLI